MIITIQEAIDEIRCDMCIRHEEMTDDLYEALDMAIDALTAQEKVQEVSNNSPEVDKENGELISIQMAIQRCDTCKHEKEPWTNGCSDCFDYELWEPKDEEERSDKHEFV